MDYNIKFIKNKSIWDESRRIFSVINFPFNHEKIGKKISKKNKKVFIMPELNNLNNYINHKKKSLI